MISLRADNANLVSENLKLIRRLLLVFLGVILLAVCMMRRQTHVEEGMAKKLTEESAGQRAVTLCSAFGKNVTLVDRPEFIHQTPRLITEGFRERYLWHCRCYVDSHLYHILLNDTTGNVSCLLSDRDFSEQVKNVKSINMIRTPNDAIYAAISRIQQLQMVPVGTRIALSTAPERVDGGNAWDITWKARSPHFSQSYLIRMRISRSGGEPILAVNRREMN